MRVKPWPILIIALVHILAPIFNIVVSAYLNHVEILDYTEYLILNKKPLDNAFWFILPIVTGLSILRFRKWSYFLFLSFTTATSILFINDWISTQKFPLEVFILLESVNIIIFTYFLLPSVRNVYLKPSLRWWEQKPRYLVDLKTRFETKTATANGLIKNISEGGALIQTELPVSRGDIFILTFELFQKNFNIETQVIFKGQEGYGVFFVKVLPSQNELNKSIDQLAIQGFPLRTPVPTLKESFKSWLKDLIRGKGLFPQHDARVPTPIISESTKDIE